MTNADYNDIRRNILKWYHIDVPVNKLKEILKEDKDLYLRIASYNHFKHGLDTAEREELIEAIGSFVTEGRTWPVNCTPEDEANKFYNTFHRLAKKHNIKICQKE